jgi:hypothetical protein
MGGIDSHIAGSESILFSKQSAPTNTEGDSSKLEHQGAQPDQDAAARLRRVVEMTQGVRNSVTKTH